MQIVNIPKTVIGFTQPRESKVTPGATTAGDIPVPRTSAQVDALCNGGALSGGIQGMISGARLTGIPGAVTGAVSGAVGGLVGTKIGFKYQSFPLAMAAGAGSGAVSAAAITFAMGLLTHTPITLPNLAGNSLMGALTGLVGTLGGSRRAVTRDSVYGGYTAGLVASQYTHNPLAALAGAAGAGIGGRAQTAFGRAALGTVSGAALGALTSLPYFLAGHPLAAQALVEGVTAGAITAPAGTTVGPVFRQVTRNAQDEMVAGINNKLDPWLEKHPLGTGGKMAAGAALGALTLGSFGMLAPVLGVAMLPALSVSAGAGAALGAYKIGSAIRQKEKAEVAEKYLRTYLPAGPAVGNVLANLKTSEKS
ncbi:MAG: hypothetical protein U0931_16800 [Vulcanimicrobiota bacterium]